MNRDDIVKYTESLHSVSDEPSDGVIWLRQDQPDLWLLEVLPEIPDYDVWPAYVWGPSIDYKFTLHSFAGPMVAFEKAIQDHPDLAKWICNGNVIIDSESIKKLINLSQQIVGSNE